MAIGPGKYDDLCTLVREKANAEGAIVIILGGDRGSGFSCQTSMTVLLQLCDVLDDMVKQIRQQQQHGPLQ